MKGCLSLIVYGFLGVLVLCFFVKVTGRQHDRLNEKRSPAVVASPDSSKLADIRKPNPAETKVLEDFLRSYLREGGYQPTKMISTTGKNNVGRYTVMQAGNCDNLKFSATWSQNPDNTFDLLTVYVFESGGNQDVLHRRVEVSQLYKSVDPF